MISIRRVFLCQKGPAVKRLAAEHVEVVEGYPRTHNHLGVTVAGQNKLAILVGCNAFESVSSIAIVSELGVVKIDLLQTLERRRMPEGHQALRLRKGQRPKQDRTY